MKSAIARKLKLIWLDEIVFTKTTNLTHAWSKSRTNIHVPCEAMGASYTAVIASISEGCGFELIELHDKAVDENIFSAFLYNLHAINKKNKVVIVMDNLSAHKTDLIKRQLKMLKMEYILNVPYSPEFNAIELPFSQVKKCFKELKLQHLANNRKFSQDEAINESFSRQSKEYVDKCIAHA